MSLRGLMAPRAADPTSTTVAVFPCRVLDSFQLPAGTSDVRLGLGDAHSGNLDPGSA